MSFSFKGMTKSIKRAPHMMGSRVGLSSKSHDAEFDELNRRFTALEDAAERLAKDSTTFRDSVLKLITSQDGFGVAFAALLSPVGSEMSLAQSHPEAAETINNIVSYQSHMQDIREAVQPDVDLLSTRICEPLKELQDTIKKIRKTITKRDHKLVDFDRHNNSYAKLKDKKEKSLNDEKNLFKFEQELEVATSEYEHYNGMLKEELPQFFQLATAFITPLFHTFYFIQIGILYTLLEKIQSWGPERYGDLDISQLEVVWAQKIGDTPQQFEDLQITKKYLGTAKFMSTHRNIQRDTGSVSSFRTGSSGGYSRKPSIGAKPPPSRTGSGSYSTSSYARARTGSSATAAAAAGEEEPPPPPYQGAPAPGAAPLAGKRAPPPPPTKRKPSMPSITYVTALYDYAATAEGDLSFSAGDRIELVKRTESEQD